MPPERPDRPDYKGGYSIWLRSDERGEYARIVVRLDVEQGERRFYCVALQLRDDRAGGRMRDIVRYDEWHGEFHRHAPGLPPGPPTPLVVPPGVDATKVAIDDILANAEPFIRVANLTDYEVPEGHE